VIDLHCHLLPGIDDGPPTLEDSLELARAAAAAGTRTIVATPHIDHHWNVDPHEVAEMVDRVRDALDDAGIQMEVLSGGEIALSRLTDLDADDVHAVRLGGGPYILLECPHRASGSTSFATLAARLLDQGEAIVLAHPERSPTFQRHPEALAALVRDGAVTSVTASSLLGSFGSAVRSLSLRLLSEGLVHNLASDSHDAHRRGPALLAGLHAAERDLPGSLRLADWLTEHVPRAILAGDELPLHPPLPRRPSGLRRLLNW
jgi:protein-tyrosine phosphatase